MTAQRRRSRRRRKKKSLPAAPVLFLLLFFLCAAGMTLWFLTETGTAGGQEQAGPAEELDEEEQNGEKPQNSQGPQNSDGLQNSQEPEESISEEERISQAARKILEQMSLEEKNGADVYCPLSGGGRGGKGRTVSSGRVYSVCKRFRREDKRTGGFCYPVLSVGIGDSHADWRG